MALLFGIPDLIGGSRWGRIFPPIPGNLFYLGHHMVTKGECVCFLFWCYYPPGWSSGKWTPCMTFRLIKSNQINTSSRLDFSPVYWREWSAWVVVYHSHISLMGSVDYAQMLSGLHWSSLPPNLWWAFADKFNFDMQHHLIYWISGLALVGLVFGILLHNKIHARYLQKGFAWLVVGVGSYMLITTLNTILFH